MSEVKREAAGQPEPNLPESSSTEPAKISDETKQGEVNEAVKVDAHEGAQKDDTHAVKKEETSTEVKADIDTDKKDQEPLTEANGTETSATDDKKNDESSAGTQAKEGDADEGQKDEKPTAITSSKDIETVDDKEEEKSSKEPIATEVDKVKGHESVSKPDDNEKKQPERGSQKSYHAARKQEQWDKSNWLKAKTKGNIKSDASTLEISSDPEEIRKQVEFYFSDSNLPWDKFLMEKVGGISNHPIDIKLIHNFKRMRHFQPYTAVVAALKDSQILEVTENEQKGFDDETPTTQFDIEAFFKPCGPINAIRLRRTVTNIFKGSVFVEFADEALQQAFLAMDPKPQWKGKDLLIESKKDYVDRKAADIAAGRIPRPKPNPRYAYEDRSNKGIDQNDWKKRREEDSKNGFKDNRGGRGVHKHHHNHNHGRGGGRGGGRGDHRGRGGRGRGRGRGKFVEPDPHKIPEIQCTTPDEYPGPIKKETKQAKSPGTQTPKTISDSTKTADTSTEVKPTLPQTDNKQVEESSKKPQPDTTTKTTAPAAVTERMDLDAAAGKKRARERDDDGVVGKGNGIEGGGKREGTPPKKIKLEGAADIKSELTKVELQGS
ncbi:MAG: hypothetical protein M1816_002862 [Peltula sp. TS41687]|nr:MAG: hypothetical protein M1816_002862 [Peltula sp. TS41687]